MTDPLERIELVYVPPGARPRDVVVLGETTDWRNGIRMEPRADGAFACTLDLPVGVYAYKLLVDGVYLVDPRATRTTSHEGRTDGLLVVGGAEEPFVFAPAAPYVVATSDGVRVYCGVRKSALAAAGGAPVVTLAPPRGSHEDGHGSRREVALEAAYETDDLAYFSAHVPWLARSFTVELSLGKERAGPFAVTRSIGAASARSGPPPDWQDAVLYTVFVDRFRPAESEFARGPYVSTREALGGHLDGVTRSLGDLVDLGVDTIVLTPVHVGESCHRYDFVDPLVVCPLLGGDDAFVRLVDGAHARGLRVIVDLAFSHAGASFPWALDVLARGEGSPYAGAFLFSRETPRQLLHYGTRTRAPLVDLDDPRVQELVLRAVAFWADLGVDGLRLDMTAELPPALGRAVRDLFRKKNPHGLVFGEVVPLHAHRYHRLGIVDASTDFFYFEAARRTFAEGRDTLADLRRAVVEGDLRRGVEPRTSTLRFLSTHDHERFATLAETTRAAVRGDETQLAWLFTVVLPGIPMLLYGDEIGLKSLARERKEIEDVWPDRMPMIFDGPLRDEGLRAHVKRTLALRREHVALRRGDLEWLHVEDDLLVLRRRHADDVVDVLFSTSDVARDVDLEDDALPQAVLVLSSGGATLSGSTVTLPGRSAAVLARSPQGAAAARGASVRRNLRLVDDDVRHGRARALARPTRIDFAVTEGCNLSCVHCITFAPQKTRDRTFRTLAPSTLDALAEDLSYASYFGFVHGGESLTSDMTFRALEAIRDAKANEPYMAHLLTNGLLFDAPCARRLVGLGVRSVSISLDGARAATNDAIRVGGRFSTVVANVRSVVALRKQESLDLRLGISFVMMRENEGELVELVHLAADLGVDWVKLEELVPVTPRAKRSLLAMGHENARLEIARAREAGERRGLRIVDHTSATAVFVCTADDEANRFFADDAFANRVEHMNPCRDPWATACVEPDGAVKLGDFFGPLLGHVGSRSLKDLWNDSMAREERERRVAARPCRGRRATCLDDAGS